MMSKPLPVWVEVAIIVAIAAPPVLLLYAMVAYLIRHHATILLVPLGLATLAAWWLMRQRK